MKRLASTPFSFGLTAVLLALAAWLLPFTGVVRAVAPASPAAESTPDAEEQRLIGILKSLHPQKGKITLKDGIANLDVPEDLRYLDSADSRKVLVDLWGNPPSAAEGVLGMLVPAEFYHDEDHLWGATISFLDDGYIKDEDADKINYDDRLKELKEAQEKANVERRKGNYQALTLLGWAQPPRYDKTTKKLYWAMELQAEGARTHTLNYDIRILGRRGALVLGIISGMDQLAQMNNAAPQMLATINFNEGHRYADFNPKTDKVAPYALAGLIGGGLLVAKMGGLKWLIALLLAGKKFVVVAVVAVGAFFKRLFGGGTKVNTDRPGPPTGTV